MHTVNCGNLEYSFADNGLPAEIRLPEEFGRRNLLGKTPALLITLEDKRILQPASSAKAEPDLWKSKNGATIVEFSPLQLVDGHGEAEPGFRLVLRHELFEDGTAFTNAFFTGESLLSSTITGFELRVPLELDSFETVRWSLSCRPKIVDGTLIQTSTPERELLPDNDRLIKNGIFPLAGFNLWSSKGPSCYAEFFMEGDNVLAGNPDNNESSVTWHGGNPLLRWNFQKEAARPVTGPWQWRNRWGWVIAPAPKTRHFPPLAMYHYFDNLKRYPTDEALDAIVKSGCDVLILHENWRSDPQNGGQPYDPVRFKEIVDFAHGHGLRIMLYIRGNEQSVIGENADWFAHLLQYNYDGLYMDYGGPFHYLLPPDETFQGGSIGLRRHYIEVRRRRETVGPDGLLFSHTGPMFSALGMTGGNVDGYVSGEGERGLLVKSRLDHAYFSMSAVCPGTMWTAAFPEYSAPGMIPFLAATGQSPHVPIGAQFPSSSLAHPPVPGIGDVNFRPLWKLWSLMKGTTDLQIFNDYNCQGIFKRSEEIAHYLMKTSEKAVCIFANFSDQSQIIDADLDWGLFFSKAASMRQTLCRPTTASPGKASAFTEKSFELAPGAVAAIALGEFSFAEYEKPYPELTPAGKKHLENVAQQRCFREGLGTAPDWFIKISVADLPIAYEASMVIDLFDNRFELNEIVNGQAKRLGFIGKHGFQLEPTLQKDFIVNGQESDWIALKRILGSGKKHLALRSLHRGDLYYKDSPFYSFIKVAVARQAGKPDYVLQFMNELEPDRSTLNFTLEFAP